MKPEEQEKTQHKQQTEKHVYLPDLVADKHKSRNGGRRDVKVVMNTYQLLPAQDFATNSLLQLFP